MDPATYKLIHYIGVFLVIGGISALIFADGKSIKQAAISHGIGLLLILLGGFGMAKHEAIGFSWWFWAKVIIWLLLGATLTVTKKKLLPPTVTWVLVLILASIAAYLGFANSVILRIG